MLALQYCSRSDCSSLLSPSDLPGTVCRHCRESASSSSLPEVSVDPTRRMDGSPEVGIQREQEAMGSTSSTSTSISTFGVTPKLNFQYDTAESFPTLIPPPPPLYPGHPLLVRAWTGDRPGLVRGWTEKPTPTTHLSYPKPSHDLRICSRTNCGRFISVNGVRRGDVHCRACRKQQRPAMPSSAPDLFTREPLVQLSQANIEPVVINLVEDDEEMNLDLVYPEEEDTASKVTSVPNEQAPSTQPPPAEPRQPANLPSDSVIAQAQQNSKLCNSPDCKNVTTSASSSRCMSCIRKDWLSRKAAPPVPTLPTSLSAPVTLTKRRKSVHWADELECRRPLSATRSLTPDSTDDETPSESDTEETQLDKLASLTAALQKLKCEHAALLGREDVQDVILRDSESQFVEQNASGSPEDSEASSEESDSESEVTKAPYKLYIRIPALATRTRRSEESDDSDTPLSKCLRFSLPSLSNPAKPHLGENAIAGWDSDLTELSEMSSSEDSDETDSEEETPSLLPKLLIRIPARLKQQQQPREHTPDSGPMTTPCVPGTQPLTPKSSSPGPPPDKPPLAAPEIEDAPPPEDHSEALLAASQEIGTPEEVLQMYSADTPARKCPSTRCRQRLIPPLDSYQFKHCPECRLRMRIRQRQNRPAPTRANGDTEVMSDARRCSIGYCAHILPPLAEYKYRMCHSCRYRTRQRSSARRATEKGAYSAVEAPQAAASTDNSQPEASMPIPENLNLVTDFVANSPKRADGLCVSYDCGVSVLDSDWAFAECRQCQRRRAKLDPVRYPFIRGTIDAGLVVPDKKKKKDDARVEAKASKVVVTKQPRSPYPQYQSLSSLLSQFHKRFVGFFHALVLWSATPLSDPEQRGESVSVKFAFDGEFSVVALDLNLLQRSASILESIAGITGALEKIIGVVFSPRSQSARYGGIVARFQCEHQTAQSGRMDGELEIVVLPDASYQYFPGQRSVIRFRLTSAKVTE